MEKLYDLTDREVAAVLAGLRVLQSELEWRGELHHPAALTKDVLDIMDSGGGPLTTHEIDALCEYLNTEALL